MPSQNGTRTSCCCARQKSIAHALQQPAGPRAASPYPQKEEGLPGLKRNAPLALHWDRKCTKPKCLSCMPRAPGCATSAICQSSTQEDGTGVAQIGLLQMRAMSNGKMSV